MYEPFDRFLSFDTLFSGDQADEDRFYEALAIVVHKPGFSPDAMGDYFMERKQVPDGHPLWQDLVADYVAKAWAVKDFLRVSALQPHR
jgi:hypothetical protein